jgi:hypothetical protein
MRAIVAWLLVGASHLPGAAADILGGALPPGRLPAVSQGAIAAAIQATRAAESIVSGDAWIGLAGAIVGAVIGFGAAVLAVALTARDADRRHRQAVDVARQTILGEVTINQENFRADWYWVRDSPLPADVAPVNRAGMYPAPAVITSAWDSQIGLVPDAFSARDALDLHRFYASAHTAVAVRETMQNLYVSDTAQQSRNEAFDIYKSHARRVMDYVVPQASRGDGASGGAA